MRKRGVPLNYLDVGGGLAVVFVTIDWRDLPDAGSGEMVGEAPGGHGVDFVIGGGGHQMTKTVEVEFLLGEFGEDVGAVGFKPVHLGG